MNQTPNKACIFGASPGTGNQGVNALCWSTLNGLAERGCSDLHVFDFGRETREDSIGDISYTRHGITVGRRIWQDNHLIRTRLAASAGIRGNSIVRSIASADLVLDVSGGDSFTDLYGGARFRQIAAPKQIALDLRRPLVLLPQTFGPFKGSGSRRVARRLISGARLAYARDADSYQRLQDLLGDQFDPLRHRLGVDLAFGLAPRDPAELEPAVARLLAESSERPLIGLNVSGLIVNRPQSARNRFGLACDYGALMHEFLTWVLENTDARVILTPHVHAPQGHYESDLDASLSLLEGLRGRARQAVSERVAVVTQPLDACELKWLIARTDWFCGTRMHSTIASLSTGVATAALAYSVKTRGVFATCGMADTVVDLRESTGLQALTRLQRLWKRRQADARTLSEFLPRVRGLASRQLDEIVNCAQGNELAGQVLPC